MLYCCLKRCRHAVTLYGPQEVFWKFRSPFSFTRYSVTENALAVEAGNLVGGEVLLREERRQALEFALAHAQRGERPE